MFSVNHKLIIAGVVGDAMDVLNRMALRAEFLDEKIDIWICHN